MVLNFLQTRSVRSLTSTFVFSILYTHVILSICPFCYYVTAGLSLAGHALRLREIVSRIITHLRLFWVLALGRAVAGS